MFKLAFQIRYELIECRKSGKTEKKVVWMKKKKKKKKKFCSVLVVLKSWIPKIRAMQRQCNSERPFQDEY